MKSMKFIAIIAILALAFVVAHAEEEEEDAPKVTPKVTAKTTPKTTPKPTPPAVFSVLGNDAHYLKFGKTVSSKSFDVAFSAQAANDVHVAFMCGEKARTQNAYEVVIGGWGNTRSVIRRGTQGANVASVVGARATANKMTAYWVSYENGVLSVSSSTEDDFLQVKADQLPCERLTVAFGGLNTPVHFSKVHYDADDDYSAARIKKSVVAAQAKKLAAQRAAALKAKAGQANEDNEKLRVQLAEATKRAVTASENAKASKKVANTKLPLVKASASKSKVAIDKHATAKHTEAMRLAKADDDRKKAQAHAAAAKVAAAKAQTAAANAQAAKSKADQAAKVSATAHKTAVKEAKASAQHKLDAQVSAKAATAASQVAAKSAAAAHASLAKAKAAHAAISTASYKASASSDKANKAAEAAKAIVAKALALHKKAQAEEKALNAQLTKAKKNQLAAEAVAAAARNHTAVVKNKRDAAAKRAQAAKKTFDDLTLNAKTAIKAAATADAVAAKTEALAGKSAVDLEEAKRQVAAVYAKN